MGPGSFVVRLEGYREGRHAPVGESVDNAFIEPLGREGKVVLQHASNPPAVLHKVTETARSGQSLSPTP